MRKQVVGLIIIVLLVAAAATSWLLFRPATNNSTALRDSIKQSQTRISYDLFYPATLPAGFQYDKTTGVQYSSGIVTYALDNPSNKDRIVITIQSKPEGVQFDDFYNRVLKNKADVFNKNGKAVIGLADKNTLGSLVSTNAWLLVNAPENIDSKAITDLIGSLQRP